VKLSQERSEKIYAGVFPALHGMIKSELREEFESVLSARVKTKETGNEGLSTVLSGAAGRSQLGKEKQAAKCNDTSARGTDYSAGRPVQKPEVLDGRSSWEAYVTQFEMWRRLN
jgi:hypothetical protein